MTETEIIENKKIRDEAIGRIDVLNKVKKLLLIPKMEVMTTKMVADFYEVNIEAIQKVYQRNKTEVDLDGIMVKSYKEFLNIQNVQLENISHVKGKTILKINDNMTLEIPNRGIKVFPQRAILRIGMLLRDSRIAKEVRTQLLNIFDRSTKEQKTTDINEELQLQLNMVKAIENGEPKRILLAWAAYETFQNRHIKNLETENDIFAKASIKWGKREVLNSLVRALGANCFHGNFAQAWNSFYRNFNAREKTCLKGRKGNGNIIDKIKDDEWDEALKVAAGLCHSNKLDVGQIVNSINYNSILKN